MKKLIIKPSKSTPEILFDPANGVFRIHGSSYPENAYEFYCPVIDWIHDFVEQHQKKVEFSIKMKYFDTASSKCFLEIFEILELYHNKGNKVNINWLYDENDYDSIENAEELFTGLTIPFNFVKE